ncbi:MAG: hypothetical protein RR301_11630 [Clostridia bacterium]
MNRQIKMFDLLPNDTKQATREFVEAIYEQRKYQRLLESSRNRHEGYGLLAEKFVALCGAMDQVKAGMKDCLKMLPSDDFDFQETVDATYNSLLELNVASAQMGAQALNVATQTVERQQNPPLVELIEGAEDGSEIDELLGDEVELTESDIALPDEGDDDE